MTTDWMSAAEALTLVSVSSIEGVATRSICSRAHAGLVAARARRLIIGDTRQDDVEVPSKFWWARGKAALKQNWTAGDFETWYERKVHCFAYGVEFLRTHIEDMVPARQIEVTLGRGQPGNFASANQCVEELRGSLELTSGEVEALLVRHCRAGLLPSRCTRLWWRISTRYNEQAQTEDNVAIPDWVWEDCLSRPEAVLNWPANKFAGEGTLDGDPVKVKVMGVEFEVTAIVDVERLARSSAAGAGENVKPAQVDAAPNRKGRPLSEQWPQWVAELAAVIHNEGIPPGEGSQGQEELIRKVANALAERGSDGPSRTTVQPVVQAVLDRLRSAGN